MIAFIEGKVRFLEEGSVVVDVHGIGYEVFVYNPQDYQKGSEVFFYTYQHLREDTSMLYGFTQKSELELFKRLIQVKGIGVKTAMSVFGHISSKEMIEAIDTANVARLKKLPGIGAKSASQIILDLQGKVVLEKEEINPSWNQAKEALAALGYKPADLEPLQKEVDITQPVPEIIRKCLQLLAKRKGMI